MCQNPPSRVRGWVDSLASEPEKELQDLGARLRVLVEQGDQVLERRRKAAAARSEHRVRAIAPFIDEINRARLARYGSLTQKAAENHLARDWADRFFARWGYLAVFIGRLLPVIRTGGFIPSVDHQTPPAVSLEDYLRQRNGAGRSGRSG